MSMAKKKKRKKRVPKVKELERIAKHIGEFIKEKGDKIPDLALYTGLAFLGARAFRRWEGALVGMLGLKLATTPVGEGSSFSIHSPIFGMSVPFNSQVAGLGLLTSIGILNLVMPNTHPLMVPTTEEGKPVLTPFTYGLLTEEQVEEIFK